MVDSSQVAVGGVSSSCVCLIVCLLAVSAIVFVVTRGKGEDTMLGDANPLLKDVVGGGEVMSTDAVTRVVTAAVNAPSTLAGVIRAQKGTAVRRSDLTGALLRLNVTQQAAAVKAFMALTDEDDRAVNLGLAMMAYLMNDAPKGVYEQTQVACPAGYQSCGAPDFNRFRGVSAITAFKNQGMPANQLCCKYMNAAGDPRPSCKKKVQKARKTFSILMLVLEIVLGFIPLPGASAFLSTAGKMASAFGNSLVKFLGPVGRAGARISQKTPGFIATPTKWLARAAGDAFYGAPVSVFINHVLSDVQNYIVEKKGSPLIPCESCKDDFFDGDPADSFVVKQYTDEQGVKQWGAWQTRNGCPVEFGVGGRMEYQTALSDAISQAIGDLGLNDDMFKDAATTNDCRNGGCMVLPSYEEWLLANKNKIKCSLRCQTTDPARRCTLQCTPT